MKYDPVPSSDAGLHKDPVHAHFNESVQFQFGARRRGSDTTGMPRQICSSCGQNPECSTLKAQDSADVNIGLRYILLALRVFGLTHIRNKKRRVTKTLLYSLAVCVFLWCHFVWLFLAYSDTYTFGTELFYRITMHVWYGQVALIHTLFVFQVSPVLPKFLANWNTFVYQHHCLTAQEIRRASKIALVVACVTFSIFVTLGIVFGLVTSTELMEITRYMDNAFHMSEPHVGLTVFMTLFQNWCFFLWLLPMTFMHTVSVGITFNFLRLSALIAAVLRDPHTTHNSDAIEMLRNRHQQLSRVVKDMDGMYSTVMLAVYMTCIPVICLSVYNLVFNVYDGVGVIVFEAGTMLLGIILQMGVVTGSASSITAAANSPMEELFDFQMIGEHIHLHKRALQVSIFIQRITHCHIGLTAWNLFNVNKQTVFMLTTMILSYVFVLFKLGLSLEKKDFHITNGTVH